MQNHQASEEGKWIPGRRVVHPEWGGGVLKYGFYLDGELIRVRVLFDSGRLRTFGFVGSGLRLE